MRQQRREHVACASLVVTMGRLDEGDGFRQRPSATGENAINEMLVGSRKTAGSCTGHNHFPLAGNETAQAAACARALRISARTVIAESSMRVPGPKMAFAPAWKRKS